MGWVILAIFVAWLLYGLCFIFRPDPMDNLLDELASRELLGKMLAVPRYERIVREILADMDGDR